MRVALVPSSYHPDFGGVEEHTRHVADELRRRGVKVEIWTVDRGHGLQASTVDGLPVRYLPTPLPARNLWSVATFIARLPRAAARWLVALHALRPHMLHVHCFGPNGIYALTLSRVFRLPLVLTSHGETFMDDHDVFAHSALLRRALRDACRTADTVTACSRMVATDLCERFGASDVRVIPNGVACVNAPLAGVRQGEAEAPVVLAAGRLVPNKGFDLLLRAVHATTSSPTVQIVGSGPEQAALEALVAELGVEDRVDFLGRRSAEEVGSLMAQADVVVVPSRVEAFGIVVLEAWAAGTPLVATVRGGPADIVTDGVDGTLVDPVDVPALARVIDGVLSDPDRAKAMARQGLETVKNYSWDRVASDYVEIYGDVTGGRRPKTGVSTP